MLQDCRFKNEKYDFISYSIVHKRGKHRNVTRLQGKQTADGYNSRRLSQSPLVQVGTLSAPLALPHSTNYAKLPPFPGFWAHAIFLDTATQSVGGGADVTLQLNAERQLFLKGMKGPLLQF